MRRTLYPFLLVLFLAGCNATPLRTYSDSTEVYTKTLKTITLAVEAGMISKQEAREVIEPMRRTAAAALDQMKLAALAGQSITFEQALDAFNAVIEDLIRYQLLHNKQGIPRERIDDSHLRHYPIAYAHGQDRRRRAA